MGWHILGSLPEPLVDTECLAYYEGILVVGGKKTAYIDPRPELTAKKVKSKEFPPKTRIKNANKLFLTLKRPASGASGRASGTRRRNSES